MIGSAATDMGTSRFETAERSVRVHNGAPDVRTLVNGGVLVSNRQKCQSNGYLSMVQLKIGRHGVLLLVLLFVIMGIEDILIWLNTGEVPIIEFFAGMVIILTVFALAIQEANRHPPPRHE